MRSTFGEQSSDVHTQEAATMYEFALVIAGELETDDVLDKLFEAGCDDATFGAVDGVGYAEFAREAPSFAEAVQSSISQVESVHGLRVRRVEPDDLVTMSEIAERLGRTRESVRLLVAGERGPGGFPAPVTHLRTRQRLWRWTEVAAWAGVADQEEIARSRFIAALNAALEVRNASEQLPPAERKIVGRLVSRSRMSAL